MPKKYKDNAKVYFVKTMQKTQAAKQLKMDESGNTSGKIVGKTTHAEKQPKMDESLEDAKNYNSLTPVTTSIQKLRTS